MGTIIYKCFYTPCTTMYNDTKALSKRSNIDKHLRFAYQKMFERLATSQILLEKQKKFKN